jgi:hypothetical protein
VGQAQPPPGRIIEPCLFGADGVTLEESPAKIEAFADARRFVREKRCRQQREYEDRTPSVQAQLGRSGSGSHTHNLDRFRVNGKPVLRRHHWRVRRAAGSR